MLKVFIQSPDWGVAPLFEKFSAEFQLVQTIEECDVFVLTGGEDIDPRLYGEERIRGVYCNFQRDAVELAGYNRAQELGKFKLGICRGAQLLNVLSGGKLWQDVNNHGLQHGHTMIDVVTGREIHTSSVHHQQMRLGPDGVLIAKSTNALSSYKIAANETFERRRKVTPENDDVDVEVAWYPNTKSLCIQGHPEYRGFDDFTRYSLDLVKDYFHQQGRAVA